MTTMKWKAYCIDGCEREKRLMHYDSAQQALQEAEQHAQRTGHLTKIFNIGEEK